MTFVLTGLDIEAKAEVAERTLWSMIPGGRDAFDAVDVRLRRTDRDDPATNDDALAELRITVMDRDEAKVGRAFSNTVIEMVLASYPGFYTTTPPSGGSSFGVYWPALVPADFPVHEVVIGETRLVIPPAPTEPPQLVRRVPRRVPTGDEGETGTKRPKTAPLVSNHPETIAELLDDLSRRRLAAGTDGNPEVYWDQLPAERAPLGRIIGARSGDKGGNGNLGLWAPSEDAYDWLVWFLSVDRLRALCPAETDGLEVERHELPNLLALNFVITGLLGRGVAASTRTDPQAKGLGEYVRAKWVDIPQPLLDAGPRPTV
jgi:hypothetical protein